MSRKRSNILLLNDIQDSIFAIEEYVDGFSEDMFYNDRKTKDAVVRNFEIIGEASRRTTEELQNQFASINWREIGDLRNKMIHEYFGVDYVVVWEIIQIDLPDLKQKIKTALDTISSK